MCKPPTRQGDANVVLTENDGTESIYHAQLSKVGADLVKQGVSAGDVLTGVGDWNTANRPTKMILAHLRETTQRPITLSFAKVDLSAEVSQNTKEPVMEEVGA